MEKTTIKIGGKEYGVAYCYGTEIAFAQMAGKDIQNVDMADPSQVAYLLLSASVAYANATGGKALADRAVMDDARPQEIVDGVRAVLGLRQAWYGLGAMEEEAAKAGQRAEAGKEGDRGPN